MPYGLGGGGALLGERAMIAYLASEICGSSPRAWGRPIWRPNQCEPARFIPTCVWNA